MAAKKIKIEVCENQSKLSEIERISRNFASDKQKSVLTLFKNEAKRYFQEKTLQTANCINNAGK